MEPRTRRVLRTLFLLLTVFSTGSSENDRDFKLCGTWRHGRSHLSLSYRLMPGCHNITVSANESALSLEGRITVRCQSSGVIPLVHSGSGLAEQTDFCVYWEPLLDQLWVQVGGQNHTLCWPDGLQGPCCTDLSMGPNQPVGTYGILNGTIRDDTVSFRTLRAYTFFGEVINCKEEFCDDASKGSSQVNMIEETVMRSQAVGSVELPCALTSVVELKDDFGGYNVTLPVPRGVRPESIPFVHLPPSLKPAAKKTAKVVCTFFRNTSLFQDAPNNIRILEDVVGITVENEVINNLIEPVRISFHHAAIHETHSRKCVSWDTRRDPVKVNWKVDGCRTVHKGAEETECQCNHLTYFTIMVQLEPRPVRHLLALTAITSLGCAVSGISCIVLIVFLSRKRRVKEQSIHLGLAVSLLFLNMLFFFTGTLANVAGPVLCPFVGAGLHYALLSSFAWMGIEVFHTFWLVYMVFSASPKTYVWSLIGFGLPAVPVIILLSVGNIYGVRKVLQSDDISNPYLMCWMSSSPQAVLAHYLTNVAALALLVSSGLVMLFLVYREIRTRDEWRQNRVAFLSIWGLSCLFGTSWGLGFLDFGPLADLVLFLSCILNSFQGFFLMLRFYLLGWMRRNAGGSTLGGSSSGGSTRQHMLQEKPEHGIMGH